MDRVLFGSNTILVFNYPLLKRRLAEVVDDLGEGEQEELERQAKIVLIQRGLITEQHIADAKSAGQEDADEDDIRRNLMVVEDYSEQEIEHDIAMIDWEYADNEVNHIEKLKQDKKFIEEEKKR